jgi:predicted enzyme related to lactoylglutathione lyase
MGNPFWHIELITSDVGKAKDFYGKVFDWKLNDAPGPMPYTLIDTGEKPGGGMMALPEPNVPVAWMVYVKVDDVAKTVENVKEFGGQIFKDKTEVPGIGWFAVIGDPQGAALGVWQDK